MGKNMSMTKVVMPEQEPNVRNKNFKEVALGYTKEMAMEEAGRCLNCPKKPCMNGCPVNVPIPGFIEKVAEGDFEAAYEIITSENALPAICGRVSKANRLESDDWSVLLQIIIWQMQHRYLLILQETVRR